MASTDTPAAVVGRPAGASARAAQRAAMATSTAVGRTFRRLLRVPDEAVRFGAVADAQERTARALGILPDGWYVLHDLDVPGARGAVHHLVLGLGGVCTVTDVPARADVGVSRDGINVGGAPTDLAQRARRAAARVEATLALAGSSVPVDAVVTVPTMLVRRDAAPAGVVVVSRPALRDHLLQRRSTLTHDEVGVLVELATDPVTWSPRGVAGRSLRGAMEEPRAAEVVVAWLGRPDDRDVEVRVVLDDDPRAELVTADGQLLATGRTDGTDVVHHAHASTVELSHLRGVLREHAASG